MLNFSGYEIIWLKSAHKALKNFEKKSQDKIISKVDLITQNISRLDIKKLENYNNLYRIRSGDYRIIIQVNSSDKKIYIAAVGHRKEIYNIVPVMNLIAKA